MNYRHAFHAGNHADVLKHIVLTRLIALMSRKEQPFAYIDTHAGLGLYDLQGDQATRTGEYLEGVARLWNREDLPAVTADYLRIIKRLNPDGELRYYPGSPELARRWSPQVLAGVSKTSSHTALSDVHDSIDELRHYRRFMGELAGLPGEG